MLNPAASIRGERYQVIDGKTPEIPAEHASHILAEIDTSKLVGLRDRAIIGVLIYTAARVGAVGVTDDRLTDATLQLLILHRAKHLHMIDDSILVEKPSS